MKGVIILGGRSSTTSRGRSISREITPTSIPTVSVENIQKFVNQFGTGMPVEKMVEKVFNALPNRGSFTGIGGTVGDKGASIVNNRYLEIDGGPMLQFIRQKSKGTWKVKRL